MVSIATTQLFREYYRLNYSYEVRQQLLFLLFRWKIYNHFVQQSSLFISRSAY